MKSEKLYEAIGSISDGYIESAHAPRAKKKGILIKWAAVAACLCLIITAGVALHQMTTKTLLSDTGIIVNPLVGNNVSGDIDAVIDFYINGLYENHANSSEEDWNKLKNEFLTNIGMTYDGFLARIPEYLHENMTFYTLSTPSGNKDGKYVLHDYIFEFKNGPEAEVELKMSHMGKPVRDWFLGGDAKASDINGTPVTVYGTEGTYIAQFEFNNVNYDITAYYIELEQLKELLGSILYSE